MKTILALAVVLAALLGGLAMVFEAPGRLGELIPAQDRLEFAERLLAQRASEPEFRERAEG